NWVNITFWHFAPWVVLLWETTFPFMTCASSARRTICVDTPQGVTRIAGCLQRRQSTASWFRRRVSWEDSESSPLPDSAPLEKHSPTLAITTCCRPVVAVDA